MPGSLWKRKQYFAVQVGAFVEQKRAESLVTQLQQQGEYAYIVETKNRENTKFFRVRVGQNTLLADTQELKLKLASQGYPTRIYP